MKRAGLVLMTALLAALLRAPTAHATSAQQVPVGPRALGMGGAFTALADDGSALYWNPAGLVRVGHQELFLAHADLYRTGVRDQLGAFVLPLSPVQATGVDWYHSGFDDGELAFRENRVTLGWAMQPQPWLAIGAGLKLLTRGTDLDGATLDQGRGTGWDAGVLLGGSERWRIGAVTQDLSGTALRSSDGFSQVAYPRHLRLGGAYTTRRWGTAALDVDDRWHLGWEGAPHPVLALRAGWERDREGEEPATWSVGAGLRAGTLRADWARVVPPTLEATDHFAVALEFNFNPAQIRIEKVRTREIYSSLYKSYARDSIGVLQVRNLQDRPLETRLSVFVPGLMSAPSEQDVVLRPRAVSEWPLTAVFDDRVLSPRGDAPVTLQIGASYPSKRLVRREKATARTIAYAPGAIDWSLGMDQAAAWVTPRDPAVDELARQVGRLALQRGERVFGSRNVTFCAAMIDALRELGCAYVPDPTNPFSAVSGTPHAVDTIHYPYQTLDRLSGDCDDTSVLMASLLGNVGVATQFVDAPGHILLIADSGLHESHREALGVDSTMVVVRDGRVWVPIETTQLSQGFAAAWRAGAEVVASAAQRGALGFVDVTRSQERYEPALPPGERRIRLVDESRFLALLDADATEVTRARDAFFRERYGASGADLEASASALELVARITFEGGDLVGARTQLEQALLRSPNSVMLHNDLGVVLAGLGEASSATDHWRTALALDPREAAPALNLGWVTLLGGDSASAMPLLASGVAVAGGYEAACARLALPPVAPAGAGGTDGNALQERLRAALREAAAPARPGGRVVPGPSAVKRFQLPPGFTGMSLNLAWME